MPKYEKILLCSILSLSFNQHIFADVTILNKDNLFKEGDNLTLTSNGSFRLDSRIFDEYNETNEHLKKGVMVLMHLAA